MTMNSDFDRHAAAFMADGPTVLSDRVLDAALREVHLTNQRRRATASWRTLLMPAASRLAAAVVIVAVAIGAGVYVTRNVASPPVTPAPPSTPAATATTGPSDSATPIDTTAWSTYVSKRYGLQFGVPPSWTVIPAARSGPGIAPDEVDSPGRLGLFLAKSTYSSQAFDESAAWTAYEATLGSAPTGCDPHEPNAFTTMIVDGHFAHLFDVRVECGYGSAVVIFGGRIYVLNAIPRFQGDTAAVDHALFMAWLGTVHLDPGAADDSNPDLVSATP